MAGHVRNTKDRDMQALEVRAGISGVGHTSRDAAGLSSTNRNRVNVVRTSVENGLRSLCSETEAEIRPLLLRPRRGTADRQGKPPENKSLEILANIVPIPIPPRRGLGDYPKRVA